MDMQRSRPSACVPVIVCLASILAGCIPIPVPHDVPTETETTEAVPAGISDFRLAPFYHRTLAMDFGKQLESASDDIEIVDSTELWKYAFPEREPDAEALLSELTDRETLASIRALDLQCMIIINPPSSSSGEDNFVFLGAAMGGSEAQSSSMSALVFDLESEIPPEQLRSSAQGKTRAAWVFIPLPLINFFYWDFQADTLGSAKEGLAQALTESMANQYTRRPLRVVVLGALSGRAETRTVENRQDTGGWSQSHEYIFGLSGDQLQWKASHGNAEAQLQLYWNLESSDRLRWLCLSADQEHPDAQKRLGILYAHATEGVPADAAWAYAWYRKASANGDPHSGKAASRILDRLSDEEATIARERLAGWAPGQCKEQLQDLWLTDMTRDQGERD